MIFVNSTSLNNPLNLGISKLGFNLLLLYHTIAILIGLVGNSLVLYGSIKYKSLAVDPVSIVLLEGLAALDLSVVFFFMSFFWLSLMAGGWVTGPVCCWISGFASYVTTSSQMHVVAAISLYRLFTLVAPFRARDVTKCHGAVLLGGIVGLSAVLHLYYHAVGAHYVFDPQFGSCEISLTLAPITYLLSMVCYWIVLPAVILPISNIAILVIATIKGKSGRLPGRAALVTVSCVTWAFVFSATPLVIRIGLQTLNPFHPIPSWYLLAAQEFLFLNPVLNPIIYTITNRSVRLNK